MQSRLKLVAGLMLMGMAVSTQAQTKPEKAIEYRQGIFKAQLWNVLPMAAMVQGKAPYDQAAFLLRAQQEGSPVSYTHLTLPTTILV